MMIRLSLAASALALAAARRPRAGRRKRRPGRLAAAKQTGHAVAEAGRKAGHAVAETGRDVGHATAEAGREVGTRGRSRTQDRPGHGRGRPSSRPSADADARPRASRSAPKGRCGFVAASSRSARRALAPARRRTARPPRSLRRCTLPMVMKPWICRSKQT